MIRYLTLILALLLAPACGHPECSTETEGVGDDDDDDDDCDDADDPYLDSDSDGWPDCADCAPNHSQIPRFEECPELA